MVEAKVLSIKLVENCEGFTTRQYPPLDVIFPKGDLRNPCLRLHASI